MDLELLETGGGGDLMRSGNDLSMVFSFENMPYLAMFGGNVEAVTDERLPNEEAFDWWGNALLMPNDPSLQFNSYTENALNRVALNSAGRLIIEDAIKKDLDFMSPFAEISVSTSITGIDQLRIDITITQPDNLQEKRYIYIWDNGMLSQLDTFYEPNPVVIDEELLQYGLQFYL